MYSIESTYDQIVKKTTVIYTEMLRKKSSTDLCNNQTRRHNIIENKLQKLNLYVMARCNNQIRPPELT